MLKYQNKIEKLIKELCPDGVEYWKLGEAVNILDNLRKPISKSKREKGNIPYYGANGIQDYVKDYIFDGTFLLLGEDGSVVNSDGSPVLNWVTGKIWVNNHAHVLSEKKNVALLRYIYFYLECIDVTDIVRGMPPKINQQNLRNIKIPLPPLDIQKEIVKILNEFTELEAELEAELESRKKQYEYYKNSLLSFENGIAVETLGDVCDVVSGGTPSKKNSEYWVGGTVKWLGSTVCQNRKTIDNITGYITEEGLARSSARIMKKETTLIALVGATIGKTAFLPFEAAINQNIAGIFPKDTSVLHPSYVYYVCTTLYPKFFALTQGTQFAMASISFVRSLQIPIPPLSEQKRIVSILDKFDSLVNDISIGLPAELKARRKQYEYYRNKLLTFKEYGK